MGNHHYFCSTVSMAPALLIYSSQPNASWQLVLLILVLLALSLTLTDKSKSN